MGFRNTSPSAAGVSWSILSIRSLPLESISTSFLRNGFMNSSPLRALIFDFDGLLVNTEPIYWQVARELVAARGKPPVSQETLNSMMGIGRAHSMRILIEAAGLDESPQELLLER